MKKIFLAVFLVLMMVPYTFADDSVVSTSSKVYRGASPLVFMKLVITADASGNVVDGATGNPITVPSGYMMGFRAEPDTGGTAPSDDYDVYLRDANDLDWFFGYGVDMPQSVSSYENARTILSEYSGDRPYQYAKQLYINASGMGADNVTTIYLFFEEYYNQHR